jgi:hypothetical protein
MAFSTLLEIIQTATDELGLPRPVAVAASADIQSRQLYAAANAAGRALMRAHPWASLQAVGTITTANGTVSYSLASDYDRMIQDTGWDRTNHWRMVGPDTPQANRELLESNLVQVGVNKRFRLKGTTVSIFPTPSTVETLVYEYVSNEWAASSAGVAQTSFLIDTDTSIFDPDLVKAEIKWRFMSAKGMFADGLKAEADDLRNLKIAGDLGGTVLSMEPDRAPPFLSLNNVPDGNFS